MTIHRTFQAFIAAIGLSTALAQGTAFTYQGRLTANGAPVTGAHDFEFRLFNAESAGAQQGSAVTASDLLVSDGLFHAVLNFGDAAFPGADRWLEIAARPGTSNGAYTTLTPRQLITPVPYATRAANLTGPLPLAQLPSGVVTNNSAGLILTGSFTGNGGGLTNLNLTGLANAGPNKVRSLETPGSEQLYLRAGKNFDMETVNDVTFWAGRNFTAAVENDTTFLARHNFDLTVDDNMTTAVHGDMSSRIDQSVSELVGLHKSISIGATLNIDVGSSAAVSVGSSLVATVGGSATVSVNQNLALTADSNLSLTGNRLLVLAPAGVNISTANTGAKIQIGDPNTPNSQGMIRLASRSGTGPATRFWDIGVPEGDENVGGRFYSFVIDDPQLGAEPELVVRWDTGNVGLGTTNPASRLHAVASNGNGVQGNSADLGASGVYGENLSGGGYGVAGRVTGFGNGVFGENTSGLGFAGYFVGNVHVTGTLTPPSDRNVKRDFNKVDCRDVLEKVAALSIQTWSYTNDARGSRHLGPVAQDFQAAFGLGADDKSIATVDADGVALAALQGLNEKVNAQNAELAALKARLALLERLLVEHPNNAGATTPR